MACKISTIPEFTSATEETQERDEYNWPLDQDSHPEFVQYEVEMLTTQLRSKKKRCTEIIFRESNSGSLVCRLDIRFS
jgi:hypothetical protein